MLQGGLMHQDLAILTYRDETSLGLSPAIAQSDKTTPQCCIDVFCDALSTAKDRPAPYGGRRILALRRTGPRPTVRGRGLDN